MRGIDYHSAGCRVPENVLDYQKAKLAEQRKEKLKLSQGVCAMQPSFILFILILKIFPTISRHRWEY